MLQDRQQATADDLLPAEAVLWNTPDEAPVVKKVLYTLAAPLDLEALALQDEAERLQEAGDVSVNLKKLMQKAERLTATAKGQGVTSRRIVQVHDRIEPHYQRVMSLFMATPWKGPVS